MKPKENPPESRLLMKVADAMILQPKRSAENPSEDDRSVHSADFMLSPSPSPKRGDNIVNFKSGDRMVSHWLNQTVFKNNKRAQFKVLKLENEVEE